MISPHGNYAVIGGASTERKIVPKILKILEELDQSVIVYGDPPSYLPRPFLVADHSTAEITLNTTVVCCGIRPSMDVLSNPMVGCVYILEFPWVLINPEKFHRVFVVPGALPPKQKTAVFSALFRRVLSYDTFHRFSYENPKGILSVTGHGGDLKEISLNSTRQ